MLSVQDVQKKWRVLRSVEPRGVATIVGGFIICLAFALDYSYSNLNTYMTSYMRSTGYNEGLQYSDFVILTSTKTVIQGAMMPFLGSVSRKLGVRKSIFVGSFIYSLGIGLTYWTIQYYFALVVLTMGFHGIAFSFTYATAIVAAQKWFRKDVRGFVGSLVIAGYGFGSGIWIPLQTHFVNPDNIKAEVDPECTNSNGTCDKYYTHPDILKRVPYMFFLLAGIYSCLGLVATLLISEPATGLTPSGLERDSSTAQLEEVTEKEVVQDGEERNMSPMKLLKSRSFYQLWFCIMGVSLSNGIFSLYSKTFGLTFINDDNYFSNVGIISNILNGFSRPIWGLVYDRLKFRFSFMIIASIVTITALTMPTLLLIGAETTAVRVCYGLWMCFMYATVPGTYSLAAAAVADYFGKKHYQANFGLMFTKDLLICFIILIITQIPVIYHVFGYTGMFLTGGIVGLLTLPSAYFLPHFTNH